MRHATFTAIAGLAIAGGAVDAIADTTYDAAAAFSQAPAAFVQAINPNGVWSYGSLPSTVTPATSLSVFTEHLAINSLLSWRRNESGTGTPGFYFNPSTTTTYRDGQQDLRPGELSCAPGAASQCVLRFTAPVAGRYSVAAAFEGLTFASIAKAGGAHGATTDASIYLDGATLTTLAIRGTRAESSRTFAGEYNLVAGDRLDFAVSGGGDGFASDLTHLSVQVTALPVPEPEAGWLLLAGLGLVGSMARRLRRN